MRQKQSRTGLGQVGGQDRVRCTGKEAVNSATPPNTTARSVARVMPTVRSSLIAEVAMTTSTGSEFYVPTATLDLHPDSLIPVEGQCPEKYLYLSKRFLSYLRRGFVPNPIPLSLVTVSVNNNDFPPVPSVVFGPPTGSNIALFDQ